MITLHLDDSVIKSLTSNELNILKFIYSHPEMILDMSIHEFARQVSYSTATIIRFCRKLGLSGFAELKYSLHQELKESRQTQIESDSLSIPMIMKNLFSDTEGTAKLIQEEQLYQVFLYFDSNCPIYLWAPGGITAILIGYFEKLLFSIGRQKVYKINSSKLGEHILQNISSESVLVLISTTGDFSVTVKLAKLARINNIPIISITPYTTNTIADLATVNFRFFTDQRENRGAEFTSRLPIFFVIHLIIRTYLQYKQELHSNTIRDKAVNLKLVGEISVFQNAHSLSLTDTEKELLDYFKINLPSCAFMSLKDLTSKLYISNATVVRFCQKLGLKGYNEFKYQVRNELKQINKPIFSSDSLISHSIALFKDNLENLDITVLDSIAELLTMDKSVYIYGSELNSLAATYLHMILATLDYPSILLKWESLLKGLTYSLGSDAVLFIITAYEESKRYLSVFQRLCQQEAKIILLTCELDNHLLPYSTYGLYTNDRNESYHHVDINSRVGIFSVIQVLIELIVQKKMV